MHPRLDDLAQILGAGVSSLGMNIPGMRELARSNYTPRSAHFSRDKLGRAFAQHVDDIKPGAQVGIDLIQATPKGDMLDRLAEVARNPGGYASSTAPGKTPTISINPKAGREFLAHELGHIASQQTDLGHLAATIRANPKVAKAMAMAVPVVGIGAGTAAALNEGNNEYDEAALIAALSTVPKLADEALATRHGLAIMDKAGMRASLGQRGRLATSLMSYAAPAVMAGLAGTGIGNTLEWAGDTLAG